MLFFLKEQLILGTLLCFSQSGAAAASLADRTATKLSL